LASLQRESEQLRTTLQHVLLQTKGRWQQARAERRPPVNAIEARILRGDFGWDEALRGQSDDPDVKAAQRHMAPRVQLLQQAVFNVTEHDQPVDEALAEFDANVAALRSMKTKLDGGKA
jgi:hypothetical protein